MLAGSATHVVGFRPTSSEGAISLAAGGTDTTPLRHMCMTKKICEPLIHPCTANVCRPGSRSHRTSHQMGSPTKSGGPDCETLWQTLPALQTGNPIWRHACSSPPARMVTDHSHTDSSSPRAQRQAQQTTTTGDGGKQRRRRRRKTETTVSCILFASKKENRRCKKRPWVGRCGLTWRGGCLGPGGHGLGGRPRVKAGEGRGGSRARTTSGQSQRALTPRGCGPVGPGQGRTCAHSPTPITESPAQPFSKTNSTPLTRAEILPGKSRPIRRAVVGRRKGVAGEKR